MWYNDAWCVVMTALEQLIVTKRICEERVTNGGGVITPPQRSEEACCLPLRRSLNRHMRSMERF